MAEEFKNLAATQQSNYFSQSSSSSKQQSQGNQDFNSKKQSRNQNYQGSITQNGSQSFHNRQNKDQGKKQWKRKGSELEELQKSSSHPVQAKKEKLNQQYAKQQRNGTESERIEEFKSVQKQMSVNNQSANSLLGFSYNDDEFYQGSGQNFNGRARKRRGRNNVYRPAKEYSVQSAFKFIVKRGKDYVLNLYDPNEQIDWKDVTQVIMTIHSSDQHKCPICLENLPQMIVPKITKCGHIFCWPCVLQYLAFERDRNWKRCPLCSESIFKHELKFVRVVQSKDYKIGDVVKFNLMVRNKANIIVKDKFQSQEEAEEGKKKADNNKMPTSKFPIETIEAYHGCRILISDQNIEKIELDKDLEILQNDVKLMQSSQEFQKVPYINEAIEYCNKELLILANPSLAQADQQEEILDFEAKKRIHNKKSSLKKQQEPDELEENNNDFCYFYQSSTGDNVFLHPLCYKILQSQFSYEFQNYPLQFEAQILEVSRYIADQDDQDFQKQKELNHLPDGAAFGLVEVDLQHLVSDAVYKDFEKQLAYREKHRQRKMQREETYTDKVNNFQNEKFEQIKREALKSSSYFLKQPGVLRYSQDQEDEEEKEDEIQNSRDQVVEEVTQTQPLEVKLWNELGNLLVMDPSKAKGARKDFLEGTEVKRQAKAALQEDDEFTCKEDGFAFASSQIVVMQAKAPKKRKRGGRH